MTKRQNYEQGKALKKCLETMLDLGLFWSCEFCSNEQSW